MIIDAEYIRPNITIETVEIAEGFLYVYNYQGIHYRVFDSRKSLNDFIEKGVSTWIFDTGIESELEKFGRIYEEDGEQRMKLNLQIRFLK